VPDFADSLVARIDDTARLTRLRAAMAGLNQGEREVIVLCAWSGLDYEQAARALGVPTGTIRSRLSRARAKLRKLATAGEPGAGGGPTAAGEPGAGGEPGAVGGQKVSSREHAARLMREGTDGRQ
jgi:RNA polymerase sigma-70 factor (ECF subfamily)